MDNRTPHPRGWHRRHLYGSTVGSFFASGHSPAEAKQLVSSSLFEEMFSLKPSLDHLSFRRREDRYNLPQAVTLGLKGGDPTLGSALINDDRLNGFLSDELSSYYRERLSFDELPIPFRCVATDLTSQVFSFSHMGISCGSRSTCGITRSAFRTTLQRAGGGVDVGMTISKDTQISVQYRASSVLWKLRNGEDGRPTQYLSSTTQSLAGHLVYSNRTAELASPEGTRLDLTAVRLFQRTGVHGTSFLLLETKQTSTLSRRNLLSFFCGHEYLFRRTVPDPLRFTLGGPLRLYASSLDEYRGTDVRSPGPLISGDSRRSQPDWDRAYTSQPATRPGISGRRSSILFAPGRLRGCPAEHTSWSDHSWRSGGRCGHRKVFFTFG